MAGDKDRVVVASRFADGTPAQTSDFEFIGDKDVSIEATKRQLREQAVSGVDQEMRGVSTVEGDGSGGEPDPAVAKLVKAHEKAAKAAESEAEKQVNARFAERRELTGTANPSDASKADRPTADKADAAPTDGAHDGPRK